ncbi:hypothetical protein HY945_00875, partial [Candidatus Gottesmanbacteria bacterium]|nr:hypothetical protein [Candidatus Gottesmanbacteria bacterium]
MINFFQNVMNWAYWLVVISTISVIIFGYWGNYINEIKKQNNVKHYEEKITPAVFKIKDNSRAYIMGDVKTNIDTIADIDESSLYVQTGDV